MLADTQRLESDVRLSSQRDPRIDRPDLIAVSADEIARSSGAAEATGPPADLSARGCCRPAARPRTDRGFGVHCEATRGTRAVSITHFT